MTTGSDLNASNLNVNVMALGASPSAAGGGKSGRTSGGSGSGSGSWFEAVAQAWGQTLDSEAQKIETMSDGIGDGNEQPSQIAQLSAESMRMNFESNSENTSLTSIGDSLETMARKS